MAICQVILLTELKLSCNMLKTQEKKICLHTTKINDVENVSKWLLIMLMDIAYAVITADMYVSGCLARLIKINVRNGAFNLKFVKLINFLTKQIELLKNHLFKFLRPIIHYVCMLFAVTRLTKPLQIVKAISSTFC